MSELTAVPASAPKGRWTEYTQLSRQIKQAGLLERRRSWYAAKIGSNLLLLAAGWVAFAALGDSWWQLATAAYLAVVFTQIAFVGHDAGHRQLFRSRHANHLVGGEGEGGDADVGVEVFVVGVAVVAVVLAHPPVEADTDQQVG
ncbi:MAG TPA: hypothetical protein VG846_16365, partial [Actinomycetota bacterium]|nr:hypothetical protein [Actinomycetota bacterium]